MMMLSHAMSITLNRSSMCLYRGSTSAITAAQNGIMPIYYDLNTNLNIDPMFQIDKKLVLQIVHLFQELY